MIGGDGIGLHAVGEMITGIAAPLVYLPVSRILAGGFANTRPVQVLELGADLLWDEGSFITWDDDTNIGGEA